MIIRGLKEKGALATTTIAMLVIWRSRVSAKAGVFRLPYVDAGMAVVVGVRGAVAVRHIQLAGAMVESSEKLVVLARRR